MNSFLQDSVFFGVAAVSYTHLVIEYLKFEEGTPFPEILHHNPHVAYKVDDLEHYIEDADQLIFGPAQALSLIHI